MLGIQRRPSEICLERSSKSISYQAREPMGEIIDTAKGKIKQAAGGLTGDKKLEREGKVDEAKGKVKGAAEAVKQAVKDVVRK
jgi:uncharacterized protein YjbJ (UPF0337 family)